MKSKTLEILKKYAPQMKVEDYQAIKKELKILQSYRCHTLLQSICNEVSIQGNFHIDDDCEDFEYFRKNEYLSDDE